MRTAGYLRRSPEGVLVNKTNTPKNMTPESSLYWEDLMRTEGQSTAPSALEDLPHARRGGQHAGDCGEGWRADKLTSWEKVAENQQEQMSLKDFRALPMRSCKIEFINFLRKVCNYQKASCVTFPRAQSASFLISTLNLPSGRVEGRDCSG